MRVWLGELVGVVCACVLSMEHVGVCEQETSPPPVMDNRKVIVSCLSLDDTPDRSSTQGHIKTYSFTHLSK